MAIQAALLHRTHYRFAAPVDLGPHVIRLRPAPHAATPILAYSLDVEPKSHRRHWQRDPFGNWQARLVFQKPAWELIVTVDLIAEMAVVDPFDFFVEPVAEQWPFAYPAELARDLTPYLEREPAGPRFAALLDSIPREPAYTVGFLVGLNQRLAASIGYTVRYEPGVQSLEETLEKATGSCRDSGWLLVQLLRHLGIAARFVSGYLIQLTSDGETGDGPASDVTDLHAWAEAYLPGAGWIGFDPTSGMMTGEGHIPLAATPRADHAAPITGTAAVPPETFAVEMRVERLTEQPRATRPLLPAQWTMIEALGETIDRGAAESGIAIGLGRPTMDEASPAFSMTWRDATATLDRAAVPVPSAYRSDGLPLPTAPQALLLGGNGLLAEHPQLLDSLVRYWQQHPALSYLFSGGLVGPEGPAPRADELGRDRLGEFELALAQGAGRGLDERGEALADLLTDHAGRDDGAELAIDRLGGPAPILALRSFTSAPEASMALLEHLLLRALVLWLAREPVRAPLLRHGTRLHDRFMLPYWLWDDLETVLGELAHAGFAFESTWFSARHDLRFPLLGRLEVGGIALELRAALEPVRLLRAIAADGTLVRHVDDSIDRIELRVMGELGPRRVIACNGWVVPLAPTPADEWVGGIRFRARSLPRMAQPLLSVEERLRFDLIDLGQQRALGGCTYHLGKPDGGTFADAPVNERAAEARRLARFEPMGHTTGSTQPGRLPPDPNLPHTLDLRAAACRAPIPSETFG